MSTPTDDLEAIKNALNRASARIGCPPGDNADADLYRELSHAAELVSRLSTHPKEVAPTVESITLEGEQSDPCGTITVKVKMSDGREVKAIQGSANSIYHMVTMRDPVFNP